MKILVTGGAGFIGSHVVRAYLEAGHQVMVVDNLSSGKKENLPEGAQLTVMDLRDPALADLIARERFQVINHHAAQISVPASVEDPLLDAETNVLGMVRLLQAGCAHGLERFVFISSGGAIYGEVPGAPVDESTPPQPFSPYAASKICGETYLACFSQLYGITGVTLRYANVYGPRQIPHGEAGVVAIFMDAALHGNQPTIFRFDEMPRGMLRDYVSAMDCARANLLALTAPAGAYNIGTGIATDTLGLWEAIVRVTGSDPGHAFGPARPGDLKRSALNAAKADRDLGWRPAYDLDAGLAETWAWRQAQG